MNFSLRFFIFFLIFVPPTDLFIAIVWKTNVILGNPGESIKNSKLYGNFWTRKDFSEKTYCIDFHKIWFPVRGVTKDTKMFACCTARCQVVIRSISVRCYPLSASLHFLSSPSVHSFHLSMGFVVLHTLFWVIL